MTVIISNNNDLYQLWSPANVTRLSVVCRTCIICTDNCIILCNFFRVLFCFLGSRLSDLFFFQLSRACACLFIMHCICSFRTNKMTMIAGIIMELISWEYCVAVSYRWTRHVTVKSLPGISSDCSSKTKLTRSSDRRVHQVDPLSIVLLIFSSFFCPTTPGDKVSNSLTSRVQFKSHRLTFASNLEQVDNLLCVQVNSASYPQRDGKWADRLQV